MRARPALAAVLYDGERIVGLTDAVGEAAGTRADTTKVEADRRSSQFLKAARERVHDFVLHGAAVQRMRMADDAEECGGSARGRLDQRFDRSCGPCERLRLGARWRLTRFQAARC